MERGDHLSREGRLSIASAPVHLAQDALERGLHAGFLTLQILVVGRLSLGVPTDAKEEVVEPLEFGVRAHVGLA